MNENELLQQIKILQQGIKNLEKKVSSLEDMNEIIQLQGKYQYLLLRQDWEEIAEMCFANRMEDVCVEASDSGVFRGKEGVHRFFAEHMHAVDNEPGAFAMHMAVSPHIIVANDRRTAKGIWFCPGNFTKPSGNYGWWWGMYIIDYIREEDGWKLWNVNASPFFATPYHVGWLDCPIQVSTMSDGLEDGPSTAYNPYERTKTKEQLFAHLPKVLQPYETWHSIRNVKE